MSRGIGRGENSQPARVSVARFAEQIEYLHTDYDGEQSPDPNSRVTLSDQKDAFGYNRLPVDWRCQGLDVESVVRSCELIGESLEASDVGKLQFSPRARAAAVLDNGVGSHHMGTTRMAGRPCWGVVEENCRGFRVDNVYVASSSVFPTSGSANPTLTIVALAIRVADRLNEVHAKAAYSLGRCWSRNRTEDPRPASVARAPLALESGQTARTARRDPAAGAGAHFGLHPGGAGSLPQDLHQRRHAAPPFQYSDFVDFK
jgi:choline dehydrogenase-like flavoprotein